MTFTPLIDTNGTAGDDFIVGSSLLGTALETINAAASDDFILGDTNGQFGGTGNSFATAVNIDTAALWTTDENPLLGDDAVPHTTMFVLGTAGETMFSTVTIAAGQTITIDIDFGIHVIGEITDVVVELYTPAQVLTVTNDDGSVNQGGAGSTSNFDSFLTFTAAVAGTYFIRFREFGPVEQVFEGGETFVANVSVTNHVLGPPTVMGADVLAGATGADFIAGQGGGDTLNGGGGDDTLHGGSGDDSLIGGTENDVLFGGAGGDALNGGAGVDGAGYSSSAAGVTVSLQTGVGMGGDAAGDTLAGFENLIGSASDDTLVGNGLANDLSGGGGNDTVTGGAGNDRFAGSLGNDAISGGAGVDTIDYGGGAGVTVNLQLLTVTGGFAQGDTISGIENVTGSNAADSLTGSEVANRLIGLAGIDTLIGDLGNDFLEGGEQLDTIDGGNGTDTASYATNFFGLVVDFENFTVDEGSGVVETLISIERIIGSQASDQFIGSQFDDNGNGSGGDDVMSGGDGFDRFAGDLGDDEINGGTGSDTLAGGAGDDILSGGSDGDFLAGGAGFDRLTGGSGNDLLDGGAGGDEMGGGSGNDEYRVNGQGDSIIEAAGNGVDRVTASASYRLAEGASIEQFDVLSAAGTAAIDLTGNEISNSMRGNFGANRLRGEGGNDSFLGLDGNDHLYGGLGNDTLNGGAGLDRFFFDTALNGTTNRDTIDDFVAAEDTIMLDRSVFSAIGANGTLAAAAFRAGAAAADGSDRIIYNNATGAIFYDADGNGAGAQVQFARVTAGTALTRLDFVAFGSPSAAASSFAEAPAAAFRAADHDLMLAPAFSPVEMMPQGANMHVV